MAMTVRSSAETVPISTVSLIRLPLLLWIVGVCMRWSMVRGCCLMRGCCVTGLPVALEQMRVAAVSYSCAKSSGIAAPRAVYLSAFALVRAMPCFS